MELQVREVPGWRIAGISHQGSYERISETFVKLFPFAETLGLTPEHAAGALYVAVYYDDVSRTPVEQLRSLAGVTVTDDSFTGQLQEERMPASRYVGTTFIGPHHELGEAWGHFGCLFRDAGVYEGPGRLLRGIHRDGSWHAAGPGTHRPLSPYLIEGSA